MSYAQTITPNPDIPCKPGWCLEYVRSAYGLPARYDSATQAWEASANKHQDRDFPEGIWLPVWFSIDIEPNGHVALRAPDGSVYSSSDLTNTPHHHPNIDELISYYARWGKMQLTYLGWTEDVAGYPVVAGGITTQGTITTASAIINQLQEAGVALEKQDLEAIQGIVQSERETVVNEVRAQAAFVLGEFAHKIADSEYQIKVFAQASDNFTGDRVINDNRAVDGAK